MCESSTSSTSTSSSSTSSSSSWAQWAGVMAGDEDEWHEWKAVGDPVLHIGKDTGSVARWCDV